MGRLIKGKWVKKSIITSNAKGSYDRIPRSFLNTIDSTHPQFKPESGRYHLYVGYACPWATRTLIYRQLKQLEQHIGVSVVHPDMLDDGWVFDPSFSGATKDQLYNFKYLRQLYLKADATITTSVTVPVLWDKKHQTIVNNESSQIIRIFNSAFNGLTGNTADYYPKPLQSDIDAINEVVYHKVNNGVYKCGFAVTQQAYDRAIDTLFSALDMLDGKLAKTDYLVGNQLTEADLRLLPTLLRFDAVYVTHFKCNVKRIIDYPNLSRYLRKHYQIDAIKQTCRFDHIKRHYYYSHQQINPYRIIPKGPVQLL